MRKFRFWVRLSCAVALGGAVLGVAGVADAGTNATLTMQVLPGLLAPGGSGAVVATFTNNAPSARMHVIVKVTLPPAATFDSTNSSASCTGPAPVISCSLGTIKERSAIVSTIAFGSAPSTGPVTVSGTATWGLAGSNDRVSATAQADVISLPSGFAAASSCHPTGDTLTAIGDGQETHVNAGLNAAGLPCTPILVGVGPNAGSHTTAVSFVKLPLLQQPAPVVLTFPEEWLPWPSGLNPPVERDPSAPAQLIEYPNYPDTTTSVVVPVCLNRATSPVIPSGSDSCIVSVDASRDSDGDYDAGRLALLVQGSGSGDPGYVG